MCRKMKTILSIAVMFVLSTAYAQSVRGVRGGVNINNISNSFGGPMNESASLQSYHFGLMANIPFTLFSLNTSFLVTGKGARVTHGSAEGSGDYYIAETNPIYLEVPVTFNLNLHFGDFSGFYIGAGPYGAMGIGGTNRVNGRVEGTEFGEKNKINYTTDASKTLDVNKGEAYGTLRKFDYGATFNAGVFLSRLHVGVFYDYGLAKINVASPGGDDDLRLRTLGFSAGFVFGH